MACLSASGVTPVVLGGVAKATEMGALTVGISCNAGSALSSDALDGAALLASGAVLPAPHHRVSRAARGSGV